MTMRPAGLPPMVMSEQNHRTGEQTRRDESRTEEAENKPGEDAKVFIPIGMIRIIVDAFPEHRTVASCRPMRAEARACVRLLCCCRSVVRLCVRTEEDLGVSGRHVDEGIESARQTDDRMRVVPLPEQIPACLAGEGEEQTRLKHINAQACIHAVHACMRALHSPEEQWQIFEPCNAGWSDGGHDFGQSMQHH